MYGWFGDASFSNKTLLQQKLEIGSAFVKKSKRQTTVCINLEDSSGSTCEYKWFLVWNQNNSDLDYLTLVKDGVF